MLKGTVDDVPLTDVIKMLSAANRTGRIQIERPSGRGQLFLRDGAPYYAQSSLSTGVLGQRLVRSGALSEKDLRAALDAQIETNQRLGEILLASGVVTPEQIRQAVVEQVKAALSDLLDWEVGEYHWEYGIEFEVGIHAPSARQDSGTDTDPEDAEKAAQFVPPTRDAIVILSPLSPDTVDFYDITKEQWRIASLANGRRTVSEVVRLAGSNHEANLKLIHEMIAEGILAVVEDPFGLEFLPSSLGTTSALDDEDHPFLTAPVPPSGSASSVERAAGPPARDRGGLTIDRSVLARELSSLLQERTQGEGNGNA